MKVLITGATGLVGSELTKILLQNGIAVNYLSTSKSKLENQELYKGFYWNPKTGTLNKEALQGVTTIIHLAGESISQRWTKKQTRNYRKPCFTNTTFTSRTFKRGTYCRTFYFSFCNWNLSS